MTRSARVALLMLALMLAAGGDGQAQTGPGAPVAGSEATNVAEGMVRRLYGTPAGPILLHARECGRSPCRVRLLKEAAWPAGHSETDHLVVAAAEPQDDVGHVSGAILGIGLFQRHGMRWSLEAGSPRVDAVGSWGSAPEVEIVEAGAFGRGVVATPGFTAQGVTEAYWTLYLPIAGKYRKVLNLRTTLDRSGQCQPADAACAAEDFSSAVSIAPAPDGGIDVTQVKTGPAFSSTAGNASRWHVARTGRVRALGASAPKKA